LRTLLKLSRKIYEKDVANSFQELIDTCIKPLYSNSPITTFRKRIRSSHKLNKLLCLNRNGLKQIYELFKEDGKFSLESCENMVKQFELMDKQ